MNKNLLKSILFKILGLVLLFTPILILVVIKRDDYFVKETDYIKISAGLIIAMVFVCCIFTKVIKHFNGVLDLAIVEVILYLLKNLVDDILIVIPCAIVGLCLYYICDIVYKHFSDIYKVQRNAKIDEIARTEVKKEIEEVNARG